MTLGIFVEAIESEHFVRYQLRPRIHPADYDSAVRAHAMARHDRHFVVLIIAKQDLVDVASQSVCRVRGKELARRLP